ncbi:hypothetical protein ACXJJ3_08640 [Kribbella sp. WER1]|uniref:hypothetical protein n=1 Tax=Kribbella sp. NPDC059898 TaxID=3346995 RepID=UPI0036602E33
MNDAPVTPGRYQPYPERADLVICIECSKPNAPAIIPQATIDRHELWHATPPDGER